MQYSGTNESRPQLAAAYELLREATRELRRLRATRGRTRRTSRRIREASARLALALALLGAPALTAPAHAADPDYCFQNFVNGFGLAPVVIRSNPALGDLDGDGDLDALIGEYGDSTVFFRNTGTALAPAFAAPVANAFGLDPVVGIHLSPALADIDGDGDLDALFGENDGRIFFLQNTGTAMAPAFAAAAINPFGLADAGTESNPAFADIDGDGDLDALIGENYGDTLFFQNTGTAITPAFAAPVTNPFGLADVGFRSSPTLADIDGDGDLDALIGEFNGNTIFFQNTGTALAPAFAAPLANPFGFTDVGNSSSHAFGDIDGDGDLDALSGEGNGNTIFFRNTGTSLAPAFAAPPINAFGIANAGVTSSPALADIDGDGDLDALIGELNGNTIFFRNTGAAMAPAFAAPVSNPFGLANVGFRGSPALVDIDGDGDTDALIGENFGSLFFFQNTGTAMAPAFAAPLTNPFGLADVGFDSNPALADIDGDGDLDALIGENDGNIFFFQNTGTALAPAFAAPVFNAFGLADIGYDSTPALADIDGDGDLDALIGEYTGNTIFFRNTGTALAPAFAAPATNFFGLTDVGDSSSPAFADIDGDGDLDALIGEYYGNTIFFRNGCDLAPAPTATPTPTATPSAPPTPSSTPAAAVCPLAPASTCSTSTKGQLQLRANTDDTKDKLKWKFTGGPLLAQSDFGDPLTSASYALCIYDGAVLKLEVRVGPSATLWKAVGTKGFLFSDSAGASDGVAKAKLLGGAAGKSKLQVKGSGTNLPMPTPVSGTQFFTNLSGVTAQLREANGECYETAFTPAQVIKNDGTQLKAKK